MATCVDDSCELGHCQCGRHILYRGRPGLCDTCQIIREAKERQEWERHQAMLDTREFLQHALDWHNQHK